MRGNLNQFIKVCHCVFRYSFIVIGIEIEGHPSLEAGVAQRPDERAQVHITLSWKAMVMPAGGHILDMTVDDFLSQFPN